MKRESTGSNSNRLSNVDLILIAFGVIFISGVYLISSKITYGIGFPLDDSWIHQTYARNLAMLGQWSFRPGIPSAGSTSPLWSGLLSLGFFLHLSPFIWSFVLGGLMLFSLSVVCERAARDIMISYHPRLPWIGLFMALEWHLVWAALSGMETLLHGLLLTTVLVFIMKGSSNFLTLGLLTGVAIWVRPDGLTLLGPAIFGVMLATKNSRKLLTNFFYLLFGFGSIFLPYLFFNLLIGGAPMPNTFYAKQAEYVEWQSIPIYYRLGQMLLQLLVGPSIFLLPGVLYWLIRSVRQKMWGGIAALLWCAGYFLIYISRLPVYQHGRYLMPAMPIFFLIGLLGYFDFDSNEYVSRMGWRLRKIWSSSLSLLVVIFIIIGARAYSDDVAVIESEMVVTAKWASVNLPQDALIAAHDIGALGYYDSHELIDLAGLVSPEVIPIIRNEPRLATYLDAEGADYLIAFPGFYRYLTKDLELVYSTGSPFTKKLNHENMMVYRWKSP